MRFCRRFVCTARCVELHFSQKMKAIQRVKAARLNMYALTPCQLWRNRAAIRFWSMLTCTSVFCDNGEISRAVHFPCYQARPVCSHVTRSDDVGIESNGTSCTQKNEPVFSQITWEGCRHATHTNRLAILISCQVLWVTPVNSSYSRFSAS